MEEKTSQIALGTLYDLNKTAVIKEISLTGKNLEKKKNIILDFLQKTKNNYYMLLCNERRDYTIFNLKELSILNKEKELTDCLVDECLLNRGLVKGIDLTKDKNAIEIWLSIDEEAFVYYFFPYDAAVIEF